MRLENAGWQPMWTTHNPIDVSPSGVHPNDAVSDGRPPLHKRGERATGGGFAVLPQYALESVLSRCDLSSLATMAQVDRRSAVAARNVFRYRWTEATKRRKLMEALHTGKREGIALAFRYGMSIDDVVVNGKGLLSEALRLRLEQDCYTTLLSMMEKLDGPIISVGDAVERKYDVLAAAIYHRNAAAIRAIVASNRYLILVDSDRWASHVIAAIRTGKVAVLKALMTSGKVDLNQAFCNRLPLRYEMTRHRKGLRMMHFILSRPDIDVNADGVIAGMGRVDIEKFKLLVRHRRFDINRVSSGRSGSTSLSRSIEWALYSGDSTLFDVVIADPKTDVMRRVRSIEGRNHCPIDIVRPARRSRANLRRETLRRYIAERIERHPSFRTRFSCAII
jgi:hypothetical protein